MENLKLKALNIAGESKDPVKSLWRNVLIVALEDALGKGFRCYGMSDRNYYNSARSYFTEPNADFKAVCTFAGFDHEYIRMKATKFFSKALNERNNND
jgi:hypothetical protein|tara:strand:- start:1181 stop:1474 length:294 start_codon:yes stop_codon:yes gene_type:complete